MYTNRKQIFIRLITYAFSDFSFKRKNLQIQGTLKFWIVGLHKF